MISIKILLFLIVCLNNVFAEYTEDDIKNMKMMFCGVCKDEAVRKDLQAYGQCCKEKLPDITDKIMELRKTLADKPDECFAKVRTVLGEYAKNNPDAKKIGEDCFHNNVKKEHLANCH